MLFQKWKQQGPKQGVQADFVQMCVLQIKSYMYIRKPPCGEGPSCLIIIKLTLVPFNMLFEIWG